MVAEGQEAQRLLDEIASDQTIAAFSAGEELASFFGLKAKLRTKSRRFGFIAERSLYAGRSNALKSSMTATTW